MRDILAALGGSPDHVGVAYGTWAPVGDAGKIPEDKRTTWLGGLADISISSDYARSFERWKAGFRAGGDRVRELSLASRLLVGHGNSSATAVGLTVHRTWGVPVIPGSALKGLLAHYLETVYGPRDPNIAPWLQPAAERARAEYQGNIWHERRIQRGPGGIYRAMFGAPDAEQDDVMREHGFEAGSSTGLVAFHDALYVPGSTSEDKPFVADVLTVHQKQYYDTQGARWPNDYDSPNPVAFLTVRPGAKMLVALSGPADWTELAERLLLDALSKWGVGAKTSSGYGRLVPPNVNANNRGAAPAAHFGPIHKSGDRITVTRVDDPSGKGKVKFRADNGAIGHFANETPPDVEIGKTVEVWIANVSGQVYTLTLRDPHAASRGKKR